MKSEKKTDAETIIANKKKASIILLVLGIIVIFLIAPIVYHIIYKSDCSGRDSLGWCGFGAFVYALLYVLFGFILAIFAAIESTTARKIKKGKKQLSSVDLQHSSSVAKEFFREFILAVLIYAILISIWAFNVDFSTPGRLVPGLISVAIILVSMVLIVMIEIKWK
jgi:hypothetical protein